MGTEEEVELYGRLFTFRYTPRPQVRRVDVEILEGAGPRARPYLPVAVRGRTAAEARERAWKVLIARAGLDRCLRVIERELQALAPGATLSVEEDAQTILVEVRGPRRLRLPLALRRAEALDPARTEEELAAWARAHLESHLEP